ncbi:hypothetical protein Daura_49325 [Dactylosporangium aurantiacum]|uniref:Secreted protein n=1 Tax=Dactylosporangium aurantiacum TaxID=35754 RepID=A0A9Q9MFF3_9ACTN|nr:hypothetical protein [Dactylosporangium aurantiacum]MDG6107586.1 hypothetical protein [Dactylosporangium aurantiacum]UWZ54369.1 hypothetical protein Daura_49325 [Dactylosporangium aurantiacum]
MRHIVLTAAVLLLAACSSTTGPSVATAGGGTAASSSPSNTAPDKAEANRRFAKCMREHGVEVPDPGPDGNLQLGGDVDRGKAAEAMSACQQLLPNGGTLRNLSPEQLDQARAFAKCMREHGIDMPDPDPASGIADLLGNGAIDVNSPAFRDAANACKSAVGR